MNSSEKFQCIELKKKYPSIYGVPVVDRVEKSIFTIRTYGNCMSCNFCHDICCSYGADIDIQNIKRILDYAEPLENDIKISRTKWFSDTYASDEEFPGGQYSRTKVKDGRCVFLNRNGRGCLIHSFCISNNMDYHILKPVDSIECCK